MFSLIVVSTLHTPMRKRSLLTFKVPEDAYAVKFQTIVREGREIVVGRIKVPTVGCSRVMAKADRQPGAHTHAFILRRYDTNAISLTTMFKVAYPGATEEEETREMDWVSKKWSALC